jgi:hypothetical protein
MRWVLFELSLLWKENLGKRRTVFVTFTPFRAKIRTNSKTCRVAYLVCVHEHWYRSQQAGGGGGMGGGGEKNSRFGQSFFISAFLCVNNREKNGQCSVYGRKTTTFFNEIWCNCERLMMLPGMQKNVQYMCVIERDFCTNTKCGLANSNIKSSC